MARADISLDDNKDGTWSLRILAKSWGNLTFAEALDKIAEYEAQKCEAKP